MDYKPLAANVLTFKAGQFQKTISIRVVPDLIRETDETATFSLSAPSAGLTLGRASGTLTILDDD